MDIKRAGSQPSVKGPADWFTGTVRYDFRGQVALVTGAGSGMGLATAQAFAAAGALPHNDPTFMQSPNSPASSAARRRSLGSRMFAPSKSIWSPAASHGRR